ncbi:tetratricopeptide repeat protein [Mangrovivirga sp. M17]|uniref:Tetratricopeptide repeat protein n=1 Tax=Mangrovivirga halotolerans TaxID=2993936 RepID=A0ABT3RVV8_9BACT|nr:tetratricopeptide repeat protein [Mangrovivirga halotolerans]MCX2745909.1 tetratricopeptide repeat protein [Mangrovivirga halotolerans]
MPIFLRIIFVITVFNQTVFSQEDFLLNAQTGNREDITAQIDSINNVAFSTVISNPDLGREMALSANALATASSYRKGLARSYSIIGSSYWSVGIYDVALKNYYKAIDIYESINDHNGIATNYNNIGEIFRKQDNPDIAAKFLDKAYFTYKRIENAEPPLILLNNLGETLIELKKYDSAKYYFEKLIGIDTPDKESLRKLAYGYHNLARVNFHQEDFEEGLRNVKEAIQLRIEINDTRGLSSSYLLQGDLYLSLYNPKAIDSYYESMEPAVKIDALDLQRDIYNKLSQFYEIHEQFDSALFYQKKLAEANNKLFNLQKTNQINELTAKYESEKKEQENTLLKKQNQLAQETNKTQTTLIWVIGGIGLILLLSFIKLFLNHNKIRKYNKQLNQKNYEIQIQNEEIEVQAEELRSLNEMQTMVNYDLEQKINERTQELREKNHTLAKYAFYNAHKLRAPVASILGLIDLILRTNLSQKESELVNSLKKSANKLDEAIHEIKDILQDEERKKEIQENEL